MKEKREFVHLHVHTEYSLLDGALRIKDVPEVVKNADQTAIAITDHGCMYGAVEFYKTCKKHDIKPIIGCEVYVAPKSRHDREKVGNHSYYHLVLLCKNETGYKNLIQIVSKAYTEGFYSKPRADVELLSQHSEGLIALSACLGGAIPQRILDGDVKEAEEYALLMKDIFKDGFYLELQRHGIDEQEIVNRELVRMSKQLSIPLVATNDAHYGVKDDARKQEVLMCIQTATTLADGKHKGFEKQEFYVKSTDEMYELFSDVPEALENTVKIAEMCNFDFCFDKLFLPAFYPPDGLSSKDYLRKLCFEGLEKRFAKIEKDGNAFDRNEYVNRLEYELSVVSQMGYDEYYLIVNDFISHAKSKGIPVGPGRGSGAGSLAAYCLGITDVDPIVHELLFERFLNPERVSMPDFDVDFCYFRRGEVIDYVGEKYGSDHVAQIVTFGTLAAKAAIRDVGRVMGISKFDVDRVAKCIPRALNITLDKALSESAELREIYDNESLLHSMIDIARGIEGMPRNTSTHAAGVVITDRPVSEYVPLSRNGDCIVTQYTMNDVADLGLLKIDFLGLRYLTVIHNACKTAGLDIHDIPLDDKDTYKLLASGQTAGVFQLESAGMRSLLSRMVPKSIEDITIAISLYRPGPMDSIPKFLSNRKTGNVKYSCDELSGILDVTNGCIVYQEQVMQIFRLLAGYSFGRADIVRRAMAKKKQDVMEREREYFIYGKKDENGNVEVPGCIANGISENAAIEIYNDMATFAQYAFNKSHAACYAYLAYYSAYLKCHYGAVYFAELLTSVLERAEKVSEYVSDAKKHGLCILPPSVNESGVNFTAKDKKTVVFGLLAIKNVGESFVNEIVRKRSAGEFRSFEDFLVRMSDVELNTRMVEGLIRAGALDCFGKNRKQLLYVYSDAVDTLQRRNQKNVEGQFDMFSVADSSSDSESLVINYPDVPEFSLMEKLALERDSAGLYLSGHPLDRFSAAAESLKADSVGGINEAFDSGDNAKYKEGASVTLVGMITEKKEKITKTEKRMAMLDFEDASGAVGLIVFPNIYAEFAPQLQKGTVIGVIGDITSKELRGASDDEGSKEIPEIIVKRFFPVSEKVQQKPVESTPETGTADGNVKTVKVSLSSLRARAGQAQNTTTISNTAPPVPQKPKEPEFDLYIKVPSMESREFEQVQSVLEIYAYGKTPVMVYFDDEKRLTRAVGRDAFVTDTMIEALSRIVGEKNVVKKFK